jgi:diguanylate cyclase (GGDEF)-like protein
LLTGAGRQAPRDRTVRVLMALVDALTVERDEPGLLRLALEQTVGALSLGGGAALLLDPPSLGAPLRLAALHPDDGTPPGVAELAARALDLGRSLLSELPAGGWMAATPLLARGRELGALVLFQDDGEGLAPDLELLEVLGKQMGMGVDNARHYAALREASEHAGNVQRLSAALASSLDPRQRLPAFAQELRARIGFDRLACAFVNQAGDYLEVACHPDGSGWGLGDVVPVVGSGLGSVVAGGRAVVCADLAAECRFIEDRPLLDEGLRSYLLLPLLARARPLGVLALGALEPGAYGEAELRRLQPLAEPLGLAFENLRLVERTRELSLTDDVTPLYNFRFVHQLLERELPLCERYGASLSVIFLDLDDFKPINDRHGHLRGSRVLREVGFLLRSGVRAGDYPARWGGDEFVVILPQTDHDDAQALADVLREIITSRVYLREEGLDARLGASVGVATFPAEARTKDALLRLADERMYQDKGERKRS